MSRPARLSNSKKRQLHGLIDQAALNLNQGQLDVCEQLCKRIDCIQTDNADVTNIRGIIANQYGDRQQALELFRKALAITPRRFEFHLNLASVLLDLGQKDAALSSYQHALKLKPHQLHVQLGYASALIAMRRFDQAVTVLTAAHQRHPRDTDVLMKLFRACYEPGDTERAEGWLQKILAVDSAHVDAHYCYALLLLEDGRQEEGEREIRQTLQLDPNHADAEGLLFELGSRRERDADVEQLAGMFEQAPAQSAQRARLGFVYGKVLNDLGEYDEAFRYIEQANAICNQASGYGHKQDLVSLQWIMDAFTPKVIQQQSGLEDVSPIFIVGMPRCGSTLVEQILASHPDVATRGECGFFEDALQHNGSAASPPSTQPAKQSTFQQLTKQTAQQWCDLGQQYLQLLQADTGYTGSEKSDVQQTGRYTDKSLTNIRMIGAIHCALPKARIIHVRRHPLDTCWSIFHHHLQGMQFNYGYNLEVLGHYYRMYLQLMQHWRDILPGGRLIEIDYEQLVENQEVQTRMLLDACGLTWHEACLRFYQSTNTVRTASFMQVRKPVSSGSIGVWKHYEQHLQPLIRILGNR